MRRLNLSTAIIASVTMVAASTTTPAQAGTKEDACAIWLCLPVGFALEGCGGAKTAWAKRLAQFKSPLPSWSSCSVKKGSTGSYTTGTEPYQACRSGYVSTRNWREDEVQRVDEIADRIDPGGRVGGTPACVRMASCANPTDAGSCRDAYTPLANPTPHWIEMVIDGQEVGRFYYNTP